MKHLTLGFCTVDVPMDDEVQDLWLPLQLDNERLRRLLRRTFELKARTTLGELHVRVWRDSAPDDMPATGLYALGGTAFNALGGSAMKRALSRMGTLSRISVPSLSLGSDTPRSTEGTRPSRATHVHVDIVCARGLLPFDYDVLKPISEWTSDPYVTATLLPRFDVNAIPMATKPRPRTLKPVWDEELALKMTPGAHSVRLEVFDRDLLNADDYMGSVDVPLPPRPSLVDDGAPVDPASLLVQGWFPLSSRPTSVEDLKVVLDAVRRGNEDPARPGVCGELYVRLSWGTGVLRQDVNQRPALRPRLGTLRVRVHAAAGLPVKFSDRPKCCVRLESSEASTPVARATSNPTWPPEDSTFTFPVTELANRNALVFTVVDVDPSFLVGNQVAGEVVVPIMTIVKRDLSRRVRTLAGKLLAGITSGGKAAGGASTTKAADRDAEEPEAPMQWADIMPRRPPGEALYKLIERPAAPLGKLCFSVSLHLERDLPFCYLAPSLLPPEPVSGTPAPPDESLNGLVDALTIAFNRVTNCVFAGALAPLRTLLYLQTWQAPVLTLSCGVFWTLATLRFWWLFCCFTPLWIAATPVFNGAVAHLICGRDPVATFQDEADAAMAVWDAEEAQELRREALMLEAEKRLLRNMHTDASLVADLLSGDVQDTDLLSDKAASEAAKMKAAEAAKTANALPIAKITRAMKKHLEKGLETAHTLEAVTALFCWTDPTASAVATVLLLGAATVASLAIAFVVLIWNGLLGLGTRHIAFVVGIAALSPTAAPVTRAALDAADLPWKVKRDSPEFIFLSRMRSPTYGSGLRCTDPPKKALTEEYLLAEAEARAKKRITEYMLRHEGERAKKGKLQPQTLTLKDLASMEWLERLLGRVADVPQQLHTDAACRFLNVPPLLSE